MLQNYVKLEKLGENGSWKSYKARNEHTGQIVCVRRLRLDTEEQGVQPTLLRDIAISQDLSGCEYILRLLGKEFVDKNDKSLLYLIFEYFERDLKSYMDLISSDSTYFRIVKTIMFQLCLGVYYCHSHGVMHRELKPQHVFVDEENCVVKIGQLRAARVFMIPLKTYTPEFVTLWYRAPEVLLGVSKYSVAVDMWSLGCIFGELAKTSPLFRGDSEVQQLLHMFELLGTPHETVWPGVTKLGNWREYPRWSPQNLADVIPELEFQGIDLLKSMLVYDPSKRISAKAALCHPYFDDLDKSCF